MSAPPRLVRSSSIAEPENKEPPKKAEKMRQQQRLTDSKAKKAGKMASSVLRQKSMNGSCSSDISTDSSHSRSSSSSSSLRSLASGRIAAAERRNGVVRRKSIEIKPDKEGKTGGADVSAALESGNVAGGTAGLGDTADCFELKKRCAWVTPKTDALYLAFHDEEWGVPVHDDKKLFELLCLSGALAEMTWPVILSKRGLFREVFLDFDPAAVAKLNDKKLALPGSPGSSLLSEPKLRSIVENARQICKVIEEFGSFDKYIWNFVNHKPMVNQFRNSRQVPVKNSKAEAISKDLVKRGFRSVGPTVVYSFMQAAGISNDHLISCFRFQDCITATEVTNNDANLKSKSDSKFVATG